MNSFASKNDLIEQYKECIRKAHTFEPMQAGYLEAYKQADLLERQIKTDIVKTVYLAIENQLDAIDHSIRTEKRKYA